MRTHAPARFVLAALLCALPLSAAAARAPKPDRAHERAELKEQELLMRSVKLYWDAVRWGDAERAAEFVEDPQSRALFKDWMEQERGRERVEDFTVLQVALNERPVNTEGPREAQIFVRVSGYTLPQQILKTDRQQQTWYRTLNGWHLAWDAETALQPGG